MFDITKLTPMANRIIELRRTKCAQCGARLELALFEYVADRHDVAVVGMTCDCGEAAVELSDPLSYDEATMVKTIADDLTDVIVCEAADAETLRLAINEPSDRILREEQELADELHYRHTDDVDVVD